MNVCRAAVPSVGDRQGEGVQPHKKRSGHLWTIEGGAGGELKVRGTNMLANNGRESKAVVGLEGQRCLDWIWEYVGSQWRDGRSDVTWSGRHER